MTDKTKTSYHDWALSWPGNYCKACGMDDPFESPDALIDCGCDTGCNKCFGTGCQPNSEVVCPPCPGYSHPEEKK